MRRRLDAELVRRGLAETRSQARGHIEAGRVLVSGALATKAARMVDAGEPVVLAGDPPRYVGRGGEKLEGALDAFHLDPTGLRLLDAGASTGGFTDCLLQHGAAHVVALDVGHGQLHPRLRDHDCVTVLERTNVRHADPEQLGTFDGVVADLSFISLTTVMAALVGLTAPGGWLVLLVKPQFEAGRREVSRAKGVISDPAVWRDALLRVAASAESCGAVVTGLAESPIRGGEGNREFLLLLTRGEAAPSGATAGRAEGAGEPSAAAMELIDAIVPADAAVLDVGGAPR